MLCIILGDDLKLEQLRFMSVLESTTLCVSARVRIVKQNRNLFAAKLGYLVAYYSDDTALLSVLNFLTAVSSLGN